MPMTLTERNAILDSRTYDSISLHTAAPNDSGSNEVSGGTYARATSLTFGAASNGRRTCSTQPVLNVPGSTTVTHIGFWGGGTFRGWYDATDETFAADGTYKVTGPGGSGNPYVDLT